MRPFWTNTLAAIGALALLLWGLRAGTGIVAPSVAEIARDEFGSPEALTAISALYSRIEAVPLDPALTTIRDETLGYPVIRRVPDSWLPPPFSRPATSRNLSTSTEYGDVLAYYDETGTFVGLEFYRIRYGCFVSRAATRGPARFNTLYRLTERPFFVSIWTQDSH